MQRDFKIVLAYSVLIRVHLWFKMAALREWREVVFQFSD